jgi:hypothetical protein
MRVSTKLLATTAAAFAASLTLGSAAHAVTLVPFATYTQQGTNTTIAWSKTGATSGSIHSTTGVTGNNVAGSTNPVTFNFADASLPSGLAAKLTLSGSETGNPATGTVDQAGVGGSFSFIYEGATQVIDGKLYTHDVTNLLTGAYSLAHISGSGTSGSFHDSTDIGTLTYTSDILNFTNASAEDFSFSLNALAKPLHYTGGQSLESFTAGATGIFSAGFVPEPTTWAMMIMGFGLMGLAARRRRVFAA